MGRRPYRSYGRNTGRRGAYGYERAREHISQAAQLSKVLGGTDRDVKAYFFALGPDRLRLIFGAYEKTYGKAARDYAEKTLPNWRAGRTQMSGLVAERLFQFLPPWMPLADKYRLTETLWKHYGPSSRKFMLIGLEVPPDEVAAAAQTHLSTVIGEFNVPPALADRFAWLAAGDVQVKQVFLNRLLDAERALAAESIRQQLPVLLNHLAADSRGLTGRIAQTVKVGKHELEIVLNKRYKGLTLVDRMPYASSGSAAGNLGCIGLLIFIAVVWWLASRH